MAKIAEIFSFLCLFEVDGRQTVVKPARPDLHLDEFDSPEVLPQSPQFLLRHIEVQILDFDRVPCLSLLILVALGDGLEFEGLDDDSMCILFRDDKVLVVLLDAESHGFLGDEPQHYLASGFSQSVPHQLQLADVPLGGIELLPDELLRPLDREVVPVGHELAHRVDGVAARPHHLRAEPKERLHSANHNYNS